MIIGPFHIHIPCCQVLIIFTCFIKGDSGGPLACMNSNGDWVQAGIASFASMSRPGQYPGVFTRVSSFVPWIKKTIY